jgi:hypothetical protein
MTLDVQQTIQLLQKTLLRDLGDEVDLIFRYGSYVQGATHAYSDLDISYVPAQETTWHSITVMVAEVMVDCYPIHWSRLERMANFDDISGTVLLRNEILYARTTAVAERFNQLPARLRQLQQPAARPEMLRKAQALFQETGYPYYLLRQQAVAGQQLACLHSARNIFKLALHCLAVCNQACIDTRKLDQVLALTKLPADFATTIVQVTETTDPARLLAAVDTLLQTTRDLLLAEQQTAQRQPTSFATVFDAAYPELKGDLQHLILACERQDMFNFNLTSLYHELMIHMAQALTGVAYSSFNSLAEYEQDLVALGFPDLLPYVVAGDLADLRQQCLLFDRRLRQFLQEHGAALNTFATLEDFQEYLAG